ncbi:MAG: NADH-quinone oxidoreductase subunit A [candidate division Zixibacteria bacterium CG_4_9_14_3_um_filter_46_8]|nr:MAG: NADH-quinone oxidoreductase subunit A [candidate division Zixibacteria bacterium CG_4_9_14_3_um_filter_46_8]
MLESFFPILILFLLATITPAVMLILPKILAKRESDPVKDAPYECGIPAEGDARERFPIKFYLIAILFLLFDIEAVFLYPWAVIYRKLGVFGLVEMVVFIVILLIGYLYVIKKGALRWQ